jgi:deazaflavin-dependent oxidoreductase (nitroreductase family)
VNNRNDWNIATIKEFRANAGKVGGRFAGKTLLILHTIGAKSKREHINPLAYVTDGDRFVIFASKGGAPTNPDWYHNIVANPQVIVEVGTEQFTARALITTEPERTRLYNKMVETMPGFADYQKKDKANYSSDHPFTRIININTKKPPNPRLQPTWPMLKE